MKPFEHIVRRLRQSIQLQPMTNKTDPVFDSMHIDRTRAIVEAAAALERCMILEVHISMHQEFMVEPGYIDASKRDALSSIEAELVKSGALVWTEFDEKSDHPLYKMKRMRGQLCVMLPAEHGKKQFSDQMDEARISGAAEMQDRIARYLSVYLPLYDSMNSVMINGIISDVRKVSIK